VRRALHRLVGLTVDAAVRAVGQVVDFVLHLVHHWHPAARWLLRRGGRERGAGAPTDDRSGRDSYGDLAEAMTLDVVEVVVGIRGLRIPPTTPLGPERRPQSRLPVGCPLPPGLYVAQATSGNFPHW
jgi:hypothetical protein